MIDKSEIYGKAKVGAISGLVGGFALFASFLWIDQNVGVAPGTFYKMVGVAVGLDNFPAIVFGFIAHFLTAAVIGAVFCVCSTLHRALHISSIPKGIFAGGVTGLQVYAIFFLPITILVMMPAASQNSMTLPAEESKAFSIMLEDVGKILWVALVLHVLYGGVMGFFTGMILYEDYHKKSDIPRWVKKEEDTWPAT